MKDDDIILTCLGGGKEIGANGYLLEWRGANIVLDCGMNPRKAGFEALPAFDLLHDKEIHAVVLSHAHLDHIGSITFLAENYLGLGARIFLTPPTASLVPVMSLDTVKQLERNRIPMEDRYYYHHYFEREIVRDLDTYFSKQNYGQPFEIHEGLSCTFFPAGHILGSAGAVISDGTYTLVYTGDICLNDQTLLKGCALPENVQADCLLIESTYGSNDTDLETNYQKEFNRLAREIRKTIDRKGHVLMPSFALGKAQNLVVMLNRMKTSGLIQAEVPIYVHMGSTVEISRIYDGHREYLKESEHGGISSRCLALNGYRSSEGFLKAEELSKQPGIFVFTSGMMNRGSPSAHLAGDLIQHPENGIFFTGYVAPNDLGYEVLNSKPGQRVCVDLERHVWVPIKCRNVKKFSFSAHAHRDHLIQTANHFRSRLTVWVHGDVASTERMAWEYGKASSNKSISPENRSPVLLARGPMQINESFSAYRAVIVTVGTSLLSTYRTRQDDSKRSTKEINEEVLKAYVIEHAGDLPRLCAETNSISKKHLEAGDYLYFVTGENHESRLCGKILSELYAGSHLCETIYVKGLVPDARQFRDLGMKNLIQELVGVIERHNSNAVIHATGGFKAQIAIATLIGILFHLKVHYLYEDFQELVSLPEVPLHFDFEPLLASRNDFFRLLDGKEYVTSDERYARLPEPLKHCFYKDPVQKKYNLTALGRAIFNALQKQMGEKGYEIPLKVEGESGLWGPERDSLGKILNPVVGMIMERIYRYHDIILNFAFETSDDARPAGRKRKTETFLDLVKQKPGFLVYRVEHPSALKKKSDFLTINTTTGMASYLLRLLGRRIYP